MRALRAWALAAGLAAASLPAAAVNLPDAGTKNFTPPSQTPSYLTDEKGRTPGSSGEAAPTESRPTEEAEPAPAPTPEPSTAAVSHAQSGKHGRVSRLAKGRGGHGGRYAHASRGSGSHPVAATRRGRQSRTHPPAARARTTMRTAANSGGKSKTGSTEKTRTAKPKTAKKQAAAFDRRLRLLDSA
jgi:hypothetical protein